MTEEDLKEKEELELCVEKLEGASADTVKGALDTITEKLKTATSTMTSVPRSLKFLRPHYDKLKEIYGALAHKALKPALADVLSFLATGAASAAQDAMLRKLQDQEKAEKKRKEAEAEERAKAIKEGKIVVEDETKEKDKVEAAPLLAQFDALPKPVRESLLYRLQGTTGEITSWGNA